MTRRTHLLIGAGLGLSALVLSACAAPTEDRGDGGDAGGGNGVSAAQATSAEDFGGMDALVEAAQEEGELNVIALPPDWANYGEIIDTFSDKYDITVNSAQPDAASQDEINAANQLEGTDRAPDVFDLGQSVALANTDLFAPYKVETWDDDPRRVQGRRTAPGSTTTAATCRSATTRPRSPRSPALDDLLGPDFKGKVALNGDPTQAGAAFSGVVMAAVANGGSADDIAPGVDFFQKLNDAGNFLPGRPDPGDGRSPARRRSSSTGTTSTPSLTKDVPDLEGRRSRERRRRRLLLPGDQRRRAAPGRRPAVAGVPLLRRGAEPLAQGRRPPGACRRDGRGRHDRPGAATTRCPTVAGEPVIPTNEQTEKAAAYLAENWAKAVGLSRCTSCPETAE